MILVSLQIKPSDGAYTFIQPQWRHSHSFDAYGNATAATVGSNTEESVAGRGRMLQMAEVAADLNEPAKPVKLSEPNDLAVSGNISGCTHLNKYALD